MKLTKKQFTKIEHLMPITRKPAEVSIYVRFTIHDRKWLQMKGTTKEIWEVVHNII